MLHLCYSLIETVFARFCKVALTILMTGLLFSGQAFAANVLILDDNYGSEVEDYLVSQGHTVTSILYTQWVGTAANFDAILLLYGVDYFYEIGEDVVVIQEPYSALIDFVNQGGVFIFTEWAA